jgi:chromosome segregation ATPase
LIKNYLLKELKEENSILIETRSLMEKQINDYQVRLLGIQRLDSDLNKFKQEIDSLNKQADIDNKRMCSLCEKNAKLEIEIKNLLNQNTSLEEELSCYKQKFTFTTAELNKQQANLTHLQQTVLTQSTQLNIKQSEYQIQINDLNKQINQRDIELTSLRDNLRFKETSLNENQTKVRVLTEQLNFEHENKIKCERCLEQHKIEIKELQLRLDDCVNETKKLDKSIRAAAESNEIKENETEENFKTLIDSNKKLNESYSKLSNDHEELQKIYLQLEIDYDEIYQELNKKHSSLNQLNNEIDQLKDKYTASLIMIDDLSNKLPTIESVQKNDISCNTIESIQDINSYENKLKAINLEINHIKIKKEDNEVEIKKLLNENFILKSENKNINELTKQNEKIHQEQLIKNNQLNEKIQKLEHLNEKLEDERSQLFEQLHLLLQQNQEMLTQSLQNKDIYHEETKAYIQQLNCLKRQKEILEQKIMEQYKNCPSLSQKK